jgi:hypothetical protein
MTFLLKKKDLNLKHGDEQTDCQYEWTNFAVKQPAKKEHVCFKSVYVIEKYFSSSLCVQTGSGAHPAFCKMSTGGPFLTPKARSGRDADHSPSSTADVENE